MRCEFEYEFSILCIRMSNACIFMYKSVFGSRVPMFHEEATLQIFNLPVPTVVVYYVASRNVVWGAPATQYSLQASHFEFNTTQTQAQYDRNVA